MTVSKTTSLRFCFFVKPARKRSQQRINERKTSRPVAKISGIEKNLSITLRFVCGLQTLLKEWHDDDEAAFTLACCLGLMQASEFTQVKHVFNDNSNPLGKTLFAAVQGLIEAGVLERNEDWRIRWNPLFHGSWHR